MSKSEWRQFEIASKGGKRNLSPDSARNRGGVLGCGATSAAISMRCE